jgi:hypothetical protein
VPVPGIVVVPGVVPVPVVPVPVVPPGAVVVPVVPPEAPLLWAETDIANGRVAKLIAKALAQTAFDISEGFITMVPFLFLMF